MGADNKKLTNMLTAESVFTVPIHWSQASGDIFHGNVNDSY